MVLALDPIRQQLEEAAASGDPQARALALRRMQSQLAALTTYSATLLDEVELERETWASGDHPEPLLAEAREYADVRDELLERGMSTPELLDALDVPTHEELDALVETYWGDPEGLQEGLAEWLERLHPRGRGGKWIKKPGGAKVEGMVGADAGQGGRRLPGTVTGRAVAPGGGKAERVFKTEKVSGQQLVDQVGQAATPNQRPAGMSARQFRQETRQGRTKQSVRRGMEGSTIDLPRQERVAREARKRKMETRTTKAAHEAGQHPTAWNPQDKVSQKSLLEYVRKTLTTPSTMDLHSEAKPDGTVDFHPDRKQLHDTIIDVLLRQRSEDGSLSATNGYYPPQEEPEVLFMGGGYAAGKSSMRKLLQARGDVPPDAIVIDPDQIKAMLPEFAATADFDPEANLRVYEEAWAVAQELQARAQEQHMNVIVDGITNTSADEVFARVQGFKDAGYGDARIAYADIPTEEALGRAAKRAEKAAAEGDGPNMRHIPEEIMRSVHRDVAATIPAVMQDARLQQMGVTVDAYDTQVFGNALPLAHATPDEGLVIDHDPGWKRLTAKGEGETIPGVDVLAREEGAGPFAYKEPEYTDPGGPSARLAEDHAKYFNTDKATTTVPLEKLRPTKPPESQAKSVSVATERMSKAAGGQGGKRDPITVTANGDGSYSIKDGNATYGAAVRAGWKDLPVVVEGEDTNVKAQEPVSPDEQAVREAITNMRRPDEQDLPEDPPPQPFKDEESLYASAGPTQEAFLDLLDRGLGVSASMGAQSHIMEAHPETDEGKAAGKADFAALVQEVQADQSKPRIIVGPMKSRSRASEKVATKYDGDWGKLTDVVRGTVLVPNTADITTAMDAVREQADKQGWSIVSMEDKINHASSSGYTDYNIRLQSPDGFITELQFNSTPMFVAKETNGHKLYEEERSIQARAAQSGTPSSSAELQRYGDLQEQQKALYGDAWKRSLEQPHVQPPVVTATG